MVLFNAIAENKAIVCRAMSVSVVCISPATYEAADFVAVAADAGCIESLQQNMPCSGMAFNTC